MVENTETKTTMGSPAELMPQIWAWLENVCDPEVPVLSVIDLGVVRKITLMYESLEISSTVDARNLDQTVVQTDIPTTNPSKIIIQITPTYTGCPAMSMIAATIKMELVSRGFDQVEVEETLTPPWTTDWMSEAGKKKLHAYGIAPPQAKARMDKLLFSDIPVPCPRCNSENTERIAEFGSTACKSLHRCLDCREPFDYFKCH